jgi:hypothetical protein
VKANLVIVGADELQPNNNISPTGR